MAFQEKEKFSGIFAPTGETVRFNRVWSGKRFTDEECRLLLAGESLEFEAKSKKGNNYTARGKLERQTYNEHEYWGFKLDDNVIPSALKGHVFTADEKAALESGLWVEASDFVSDKTGRSYTAKVRWAEDGRGGRKMEWHFPKEGEGA